MRVLALMNDDLVPPESLEGFSLKEIDRFKTDYDVVTGLHNLGHEVLKLGVWGDLTPLRKALEEFKPRVVFNLLEEFRNEAVFDQNVVSYLELMRTPYTGCNPQGLILARDKALSKKIIMYHRIKAPQFLVVPRGRKVRRSRPILYPVIVKSQIEEASAGIAQSSVVRNIEDLDERVRFIHERIGTAAIVEQFIEGRELYVGVLGNRRLQVFPVWELDLRNLPPDAPRIATAKVKWDLDYQDKYKIDIGPAKDLSPEIRRHVERTSKRIYRALQLSGYARLDFRLTDQGDLYFLEANPNPDVAHDEEFSSAAAAIGLSYPKLLQRIVNLGIRWRQER